MTVRVVFGALAALALAACAMQESRLSGDRTPGSIGRIVEITAGLHSRYFWSGRYWSSAELGSALADADRQQPIVRLHLFGDDVTVANTIEMGRLAESLGASAYYDSGEGLKSITIVR